MLGVSELETAQDRQFQVIDIVGDWLDQHDAHFLAKEGEIVWWASCTGEEEDYEWHKMSASELSRVIKVTRVPASLMPSCTTDCVYAAAQERGRAYMCGVRTTKQALPEYFNFSKHEKVVRSKHYVIAHKAVQWFRDERINPEWQMLKRYLRVLWSNAKLGELTQQEENRMIEEIARDMCLTVHRGKTRHNLGNGKKVDCIRNRMLSKTVPVTLELDEKQVEDFYNAN